jgi:hypothetical protein
VESDIKTISTSPAIGAGSKLEISAAIYAAICALGEASTLYGYIRQIAVVLEKRIPPRFLTGNRAGSRGLMPPEISRRKAGRLDRELKLLITARQHPE